MKRLKEFITESFDDNLFWKIDQFFGNDKDGLKVFNSLIDICRTNKSYNVKTIEAFLMGNEKFKSHLKKFIDFLEDTIHDTQGINKDYTQLLYIVVKQIIGNKSEGNKFTNL